MVSAGGNGLWVGLDRTTSEWRVVHHGEEVGRIPDTGQESVEALAEAYEKFVAPQEDE